MKKILLTLCCAFIGFAIVSESYAGDYKWGKTRCKTTCNRLACKVKSFALKCAANCDPNYVEKCVRGAEDTASATGTWDATKCAAACNRVTCGPSQTVTEQCIERCGADNVPVCVASSEYIKQKKNNLNCRLLCNRLTCTANPVIGFVCLGCAPGTADKCKAAFRKVWVPKFLQR